MRAYGVLFDLRAYGVLFDLGDFVYSLTSGLVYCMTLRFTAVHMT